MTYQHRRRFHRTTNRYAGTCYACGKEVAAGDGYYVKGGGTVHALCFHPRGANGKPILTRSERIGDSVDTWATDARRREAYAGAAAGLALVMVLLASRAS